MKEREPFNPQASGYGRPPHPRAREREWVVTAWDDGAYVEKGLTLEQAEELAAEMDHVAPSARPYRVRHHSESVKLLTDRPTYRGGINVAPRREAA